MHNDFYDCHEGSSLHALLPDIRQNHSRLSLKLTKKKPFGNIRSAHWEKLVYSHGFGIPIRGSFCFSIIKTGDCDTRNGPKMFWVFAKLLPGFLRSARTQVIPFLRRESALLHTDRNLATT